MAQYRPRLRIDNRRLNRATERACSLQSAGGRPLCVSVAGCWGYFCVGIFRRIIALFLQTISMETHNKERKEMKATGIVRRVDDLGRIVIPKEIRRTLRIREGDPLQMTWRQWEKFCFAMLDLAKRCGW